MGRRSLNLSDEERKERKRNSVRKYQQSVKGKAKTLECIKRNQDTDEYRAKKREYMRRKRHLEAQANN